MASSNGCSAHPLRIISWPKNQLSQAEVSDMQRLRSTPPDDGADGDLGLSFASDDDLFRDTSRGGVKRHEPTRPASSQDKRHQEYQLGTVSRGNAAQSELEDLLNTSSSKDPSSNEKVFLNSGTNDVAGGGSSSSRFMDDLTRRRDGGENGLFPTRAPGGGLGSSLSGGKMGRSARETRETTSKAASSSRAQHESISTSFTNSPYRSSSGPYSTTSPSPLLRRSSSQTGSHPSSSSSSAASLPDDTIRPASTSGSKLTEDTARSNRTRSMMMPRGRKSSSRSGERTGTADGLDRREVSAGETKGEDRYSHLGQTESQSTHNHVHSSESKPNGDSTPTRTYPLPHISSSDPGTSSSPARTTPHPPKTQPPTFLPTQITLPLSRYISDLLICNFHLDLGPVVERRLAGRGWSSKGEKANVAFSSFPDRGVVGEGSVGFGFKVRKGVDGGVGVDEHENVKRREDGGGGDSGSSAGETPRAKRMSQEPESYFGMTPISAEPGTIDETSESRTPSTSRHRISTLTSPRSESPRAPPLPRTPQHTHSPSFFGPPPEPPTPLHLQPRPPTTLERVTEYQHWDSNGRAWLYGFVWFQQRRDQTIARGYMQRSLVVLTHLPWPGLFARVLEVVAPRYFDFGYGALEAACREMARWWVGSCAFAFLSSVADASMIVSLTIRPDPIPGAVLRLPLCGEVLHVRLPDATETSQIPRGPPSLVTRGGRSGRDTEILPTLPYTMSLRVFASLLPSLWHLWECMMLSEPIMVIASDPKLCSEAVWWLRDLLRPIPAIMYDFRPYFHIHDADFRLLVNSEKPQPGVVIGVTNPVFRTAASHWPNIISLGGDKVESKKGKASTGPNGFVPEPEGFLSKRKRHVSKDRDLLKRLEGLVAAGKLDDPSGNEALRTHFMQMTEKMLAPVNRYIASLIPGPGSAEPMRPFSLTAFLAHLKANAPNPLQFRTRGMSSKSKSESDFYTAFCTGVGFTGWLLDKVHDLNTSRASADMPSLEPPRLILQGSNASRSLGGNSLDYPRSSTDTDKSADGSGRSSMSSRPSPKDVHFAGRRRSEGTVLGMDSMRLS